MALARLFIGALILLIAAPFTYFKSEERAITLHKISRDPATTTGEVVSIETTKRNANITFGFQVTGKSYTFVEVYGRSEVEAISGQKTHAVTYSTQEPEFATTNLSHLQSQASTGKYGAAALGTGGLALLGYAIYLFRRRGSPVLPKAT